MGKGVEDFASTTRWRLLAGAHRAAGGSPRLAMSRLGWVPRALAGGVEEGAVEAPPAGWPEAGVCPYLNNKADEAATFQLSTLAVVQSPGGADQGGRSLELPGVECPTAGHGAVAHRGQEGRLRETYPHLACEKGRRLTSSTTSSFPGGGYIVSVCRPDRTLLLLEVVAGDAWTSSAKANFWPATPRVPRLGELHFQLLWPAMAVFSATYKFAAQRGDRRATLWPSVRGELRQALGLIFLVEREMSAPFCKEVHIGDSSDRGYALVYTQATHRELQAALDHREKWRFIPQLDTNELSLPKLPEDEPSGYIGQTPEAGVGTRTSYGRYLNMKADREYSSELFRRRRSRLLGTSEPYCHCWTVDPGPGGGLV